MVNAEECNQDSVEALDAIAQLGNAATTDKTTIIAISNKNAQLCKEITEVNTKLESMLKKTAKLQEFKAPRNRHL